jgi:two-component system C4-dicarboxylate transport sensor histidine kinase DctB
LKTLGAIRNWLMLFGWALMVAASVAVSFELTERVAIRSLREVTAHRLDLYASNLKAEMDRFEYLPPVVSLNEHVVRLLAHPQDEAARDIVNRYLQTVAQRSGSSAIYVMDHNGLTLAASNWDEPVSFVNMNFAYRPYFKDAALRRPGRFYGIGTVSREAGYYFAHSIMDGNGRFIGATAVKVSLEQLDSNWGHVGEKIAVVDGNGVLFLSSESNWKYRTLKSLSIETMGLLAETRQYTEAGMLSPLGLRERRVLADDVAIVAVSANPTEHRGEGASSDYLVQRSLVPGTDWRLLVFSEMRPALTAARIGAVVAGLSTVLLGLMALYYLQRRRFLGQTVAARAALQSANNELERTVQRRTLALSEANQQLHDEIAERRKAEEALRATLNELVHTARMAVLGQMSAGITHELNQPLAALRTLSGNAIVFLQRGRQEEAASNLQIIAQLTDHMGKITSQLKNFARKTAVELRPVCLPEVVSNALFLLRQSTPLDSVLVELVFETPRLRVLGDTSRIEQVILNLLGNAFDAVEGTPAPRVTVAARTCEDTVVVDIHDSGAGVPDDIAERLFEPFFSTKEQGRGLGLGLSISLEIVRQMGGTLSVGRSQLLGGARFTIQFKSAA